MLFKRNKKEELRILKELMYEVCLRSKDQNLARIVRRVIQLESETKWRPEHQKSK